MRWLGEPPRAVTVVLFAALTALLVYPLHRPYLHPDQDVLPTLPLTQMARGSWSPLILMYGSALPNLLHVLDAGLLAVGRLAGWWREPADLLVAWCRDPWLFRIPPRAIAMAAGVAALVAARGITTLVADRLSALAAAALLGTWLLFVREHHHGWYDGPAAGAAMLALWAAAAYVRAPRPALLVTAAALAGVATSCKLNLAVTVPAVMAAALVASRQHRIRTAVLAGAIGFAAFAATSPEVVFETARMLAYLQIYIPMQAKVLATTAGDGGNRLVETATRGIGWAGLAVAAAGFVTAARTRERALVPLLTFVMLYGAILLSTPLALGRYVLPMTGPLAVLAAYALSRLPPLARVVTVAGMVALGLPECLQYVRLLGREDTRIEAARLIAAEWERGGRVLVAANPILGMYVGPDIAQLPRYEGGIPRHVEEMLVARAPRCIRPFETLSRATSLDAYAGALVVTIDPPTPMFARATTPPAILTLLERQATPVADLTVEVAPAQRPYEVFDLNFVPPGGLETLRRPGPRLRLWRVPQHLTSPGPDATR